MTYQLERNAAIYQAVWNRETYKSIGVRFGISTERVRQIFLKYARRENLIQTEAYHAHFIEKNCGCVVCSISKEKD